MIAPSYRFYLRIEQILFCSVTASTFAFDAYSFGSNPDRTTIVSTLEADGFYGVKLDC